MLVAIEGPDRTGKTTLFNELRKCVIGPRFVPSIPMRRQLMPWIKLVEERNEALWNSLYDPCTLYVCDRHFAISNVVYAALFGREPRVYPMWDKEVRMLYVRTELNELLRRRDMIDRDRQREFELYEKAAQRWSAFVVDGKLPLQQQVRLAKEFIDGLASGA